MANDGALLRTLCQPIPVRTLCLVLGLLTFGSASPLWAEPAAADASPTPTTAEPDLRAALRALVSQIREFDRQIAETKEAIRTTQSDELRSLRVAELQDLQKKRSNARLDLLDIISDTDLSGFQNVEEKPFTLRGSVEDLIKPLIDETRRVTAGARERRELQNRYEEARQRTDVLKAALDSLDHALQTTDDPDVRPMLVSVRDEFNQRHEKSRSELTVLAYRLGEIKQEHRSLAEETTGILTSFFRERGRNLLLAIVFAAVVAVGFRVLHLYLHNHTALFRRGRHQAVRLLDVALYLLTFFGALVAAFLVLLIAGDWVLFGLVVLFVLALGFAAKDALPGYMDEIRFMLNLGPVRENERLVFNGVPWLVENLAFFTTLRNPSLRGGMIQMPIAQLFGMLSRPATEDEPYFPSEEGDWVLLDDETYGQVILQSVEMVRIKLLGGALKMYPAAAYLKQNPQNCSHGFRIRTTIGIDYNHQAAATGEILEKLNGFFREEVERLVEPSAIRSLKIEFALANVSSLDYEVLLDLDGSLASKRLPLTRALQRIAVDACNRFGLTIPFQQVTLHRADASE
jgi:small-conductance mechanosensitive channel